MIVFRGPPRTRLAAEGPSGKGSRKIQVQGQKACGQESAGQEAPKSDQNRLQGSQPNRVDPAPASFVGPSDRRAAGTFATRPVRRWLRFRSGRGKDRTEKFRFLLMPGPACHRTTTSHSKPPALQPYHLSGEQPRHTGAATDESGEAHGSASQPPDGASGPVQEGGFPRGNPSGRLLCPAVHAPGLPRGCCAPSFQASPGRGPAGMRLAAEFGP